MEIFLITLSVVCLVVIIFIIASYIIMTKLLKKSFGRMNFEEGKELISYNDIKDKYERLEYSFKSKNNILKAYIYRKEESEKLVVYVHGMCPGHQGYLSDIISFMERGYNVFTYDFTATGASSGNYYCGVNQQYFDLKCAIKFLKENNLFGYKDIYLYGHSMGGYAVGCCSDEIFSGIVSISGFDSHIDELVAAFSKNANGFVKVVAKVMLSIKYLIDQGFKYNIKAHNVLMNTTVNTLVIHGTNDELVPFEKISILSKKDLINNNKVKYIEMSDELHNSHNSVIASTNCVKYQKEKMEIYKKVLEETKDHNKARDAMLVDFDVFKFNDANEELMDIIDKFYTLHSKGE